MQEIEISSIKFNRGIIYICRRYATNNAATYSHHRAWDSERYAGNTVAGRGIVRNEQLTPPRDNERYAAITVAG